MPTLKELNEICDEANRTSMWRNRFVYREIFNPILIKKILKVVYAADDLKDFLEKDIGMDKPELTFLRQALKELKDD